MHEIQEEKRERYVLIAVDTGKGEDTEGSLRELEELLNTAGGEAVAHVKQNLPCPMRGTYLGEGKLLEVRDIVLLEEADGVIADDELTPSEQRRIEEIVGVKVLDRSMVILEIFARHAKTREGKLQVELAQLSYREAHLVGGRTNLSRLGGGIGTRGPGETKLEEDRRRIQSRKARLRRELEDVSRHRKEQRKDRKKRGETIVALVGYTNAGKSTLLNALTEANVLAENKLFATLDPTTRRLHLPEGFDVLLTDTVGFLHKLPHSLIEAFKSTLEELQEADILLHVIDSSSERRDIERKTVYDTLRELHLTDKPVITLWNKQDLLEEEIWMHDEKAVLNLPISAKTGKNLDTLLSLLSNLLRQGKKEVHFRLSYGDMTRLNLLRSIGQITEERYEEDGVYVSAYIPAGYHFEEGENEEGTSGL